MAAALDFEQERDLDVLEMSTQCETAIKKTKCYAGFREGIENQLSSVIIRGGKMEVCGGL